MFGDWVYVTTAEGPKQSELHVLAIARHSGQRVWQKRLTGEYTVSPVAAGDRIYFINDNGETTVVKAHTRQFEELARNPLGESVYASPALTGGRLYLRGARHLYCVE